jgi:hypothetical protein
MSISNKVQTEVMAYWYTVVLAFILLIGYFKQAIGWLLLKLYEWFVQSAPAKI